MANNRNRQRYGVGLIFAALMAASATVTMWFLRTPGSDEWPTSPKKPKDTSSTTTTVETPLLEAPLQEPQPERKLDEQTTSQQEEVTATPLPIINITINTEQLDDIYDAIRGRKFFELYFPQGITRDTKEFQHIQLTITDIPLPEYTGQPTLFRIVDNARPGINIDQMDLIRLHRYIKKEQRYPEEQREQYRILDDYVSNKEVDEHIVEIEKRLKEWEEGRDKEWPIFLPGNKTEHIVIDQAAYEKGRADILEELEPGAPRRYLEEDLAIQKIEARETLEKMEEERDKNIEALRALLEGQLNKIPHVNDKPHLLIGQEIIEMPLIPYERNINHSKRR